MTVRFARGLAAVPIVAVVLGSMPAQASDDNFELVSTIAFSNTLPASPPTTPEQFGSSFEIYLIDPDGTNPRRLTDNQAADIFPTLSPNGKKIVFDSNRNRGTGPLNTFDLFLMNTDGTEQTHLTRGGGATWSPDSKRIAFQASASGTGQPILPTTPGSATSDSDLFVANVDDLLKGVEAPRNVTSTVDFIDDDPDWSPDGQALVFTRHDADEPDHGNAVSAEIYRLSVDGTGATQRLTFNDYEERAPDFSPDGTRIVFMCRIDHADIELCVMNADGTGLTQLTFNTTGDLGPNWSPDGQRIVFQRPVGGGRNQLFVINADGTAMTQLTGLAGTDPQGWNGFVSWDLLRIKVDS
jgi:TolB protein